MLQLLNSFMRYSDRWMGTCLQPTEYHMITKINCSIRASENIATNQYHDQLRCVGQSSFNPI